MPELPEVETLRQDLSREVVGKKIKAVAVANGRSVRRHPSAKHFRALLEGRTIKTVGRLGKYLLLTMDNGDTLVVHLGMSGQLLRVKSVKDPKPKHTHVVITFTQGGELRYVDPRTFGELFVSTPPLKADGTPLSPVSGTAGGDGAAIRKAIPELSHLGFDPIEDLMSWDRFGALLHQHHGGIKALLMDQSFTAGIGNLYSDEMLYQAGPALRPGRRLADGDRGAAPVPGDRGDAGGCDQAPGLLAGGRAVPGFVRGDRRLPGLPPGLRPRGPAVPALSQLDRAREGRRALDVLLRALPGLGRLVGAAGRRPPGRFRRVGAGVARRRQHASERPVLSR